MPKLDRFLEVPLLLFLIFIAFVSGCGIGGWWIEGNPYAARKPFLPQYLKWSKSGANAKLNQSDWVSCGGDDTGYVSISEKNLSQYEESLAYKKKYNEVEACMFNRGYRYIGNCGGPDGLAFRCKKGR